MGKDKEMSVITKVISFLLQTLLLASGSLDLCTTRTTANAEKNSRPKTMVLTSILKAVIFQLQEKRSSRVICLLERIYFLASLFFSASSTKASLNPTTIEAILLCAVSAFPIM
jgi:hypothetical protein